MTQTSTDKQTPTRIALIRQMLGARRGATIEALCAATGWQPHSVRAALSRLRKQGYAIALDKDADGKGGRSYRIVAGPGDPQ